MQLLKNTNPSDSPPFTQQATLTVPIPFSENLAIEQSPLLVLLVEDHPINQMLATTLLKKWGHQIVLANNGQEAVDLFPTRDWDLILMDMQMPVMGGLDATRLIRQREAAGHRIPIVAVTANAMESDREICLQAGMDGFLAKPFNATSLKGLLNNAASARCRSRYVRFLEHTLSVWIRATHKPASVSRWRVPNSNFNCGLIFTL
jgi:CheY-like chemotaxis protein